MLDFGTMVRNQQANFRHKSLTISLESRAQRRGHGPLLAIRTPNRQPASQLARPKRVTQVFRLRRWTASLTRCGRGWLGDKPRRRHYYG